MKRLGLQLFSHPCSLRATDASTFIDSRKALLGFGKWSKG